MRVLLVAFAFTEYTLRLAQALARGHELTVVLSRTGLQKEVGDPARLPLGTGRFVSYAPRKFRDPRWIKDAWNIQRLAESLDVDVIHVQESPSDVVHLLARITRRPLVLTVHDPKSHSGRDSRVGWRRMAYRKYLRKRADAIVVHGEALKTEILETREGRDDVWVAPHAPLGFGGRQRHQSGPPTFLLFGRMEEYKGVEEFLIAASLVREKVPEARFVVAGQGSEIERLRPLADRTPGVERIERFLPPEELADLFASASAVVLPYRDATQSGVGALAMGFGRGMIATKVGSLPEICIPGRTGVLVPPNDPAALAAAMVRWAEDRSGSERCGLAAFALGEGAASWSVAAEVASKVYESVVMRCHSQAKAS